jgi:CheY-like chemotaxis protein
VNLRRILLIENEHALREVVQLCLETVAGWQVLTATSNSEAILSALTKKFDAIIIDRDAIASEKDLSTILQNLHNHPTTEKIPVILLTSVAPVENLPQFLALGVTATISKPFDLMTLAGTVAKALHWVENP